MGRPHILHILLKLTLFYTWVLSEMMQHQLPWFLWVSRH